MLTQKRLKELLHYNSETGFFTWIYARGSMLEQSFAGSINKKYGYVEIGIDNKVYKAHRLSHLYVSGEFPSLQIDHDDHCRSNNKWDNIKRLVTNQENHMNRTIRRDNSSGFNGISWCACSLKWRARITINGKNKNLGRFENIEDAITVRKEANIKYGYHINHGKSGDSK